MNQEQLLVVADEIEVGIMRMYWEGLPEAMGALGLRIPVRLLHTGETASPLAPLHLCLPLSAAEPLLAELEKMIERLRQRENRQDH